MIAIDRVGCGRRLAGLAFAVLGLVLVVPGVAQAEPGVPDPPNQLITDTGSGQVSDADRDFAVKVRLAGLWEIPAGDMAVEKSEDARIRKIGKDIADQHKVLDKMVREASLKLKIKLPNEPNEDQQGWLDEMADARGGKFDQIYIDRLRAAHGKIFPAIATIRTSTRNDTIRKLAQRANQFVMTHLTLLESSGIVDFEALPTAPPPAAAGAATGTNANAKAGAADPVLSSADAAGPTAGVNLPLVGAVVVAGIGAAFLVMRHLGQDPRRRRRRRYY